MIVLYFTDISFTAIELHSFDETVVGYLSTSNPVQRSKKTKPLMILPDAL